MKHSELTGKIIGCAIEVHKFFGNGFQELIYQRALAIEFRKAGLNFEREIERTIYYKEEPEIIGTRRVDFVVDEKVLVELKAITQLDDVNSAQLLNYLKAYKMEVGLLINFGGKSMTFKRMVM